MDKVIIIPVHNQLQYLIECVRSIREKTINPKIIIVDDGSDDIITESWIKKESERNVLVSIRNERPHGYSYACNKGIDLAIKIYNFKVLCLLNSDTQIITTDWFDKVSFAMLNDNKIGCASVISNNAINQSIPCTNIDLLTSMDNYYIERYIDSISENRVIECQLVHGFCFFIKRELIMEIGRLDDIIFPSYGSEDDYSLRSYSKGYKNVILDYVHVYHHESKSYSHERKRLIVSETIKRLRKRWKDIINDECNAHILLNYLNCKEQFNTSYRILSNKNMNIKFIEKKNKLGVAYSVFDDLDHLEQSLLSIRDNVDFITIVYQNVSYTGIQAEFNIYTKLVELKNKKLIDGIAEYKPDFNLSTKENEVKKRNLGLLLCKQNYCTHHITMDGDEIYVPAQFKKAKAIVYDYQYEASFVLSRTYYKSKSYYINPPEQYHIPFIYKINDRKFEYQAKINLVSADSSRVMNNVTEDIMIFERQFIEMHHLCYVRKDIKRKLQNKASNLSEERIEKILNSYDNFKLLQLTQEVYTENGTFNVRLHLFPAI